MTFRTIVRWAVFALSVSATVLAQSPPPQPVHWKASLVPESPVKPGAHATIDLSGKVDAGWHVYALTQLAEGPIPLRVSLDENDVAESRDKVTGTEVTKKNDPSFQLETQFYQGDFTVHLPVEIKHPGVGNQIIPVSVRFQACSDRTCLPPRTIHLSVLAEVVSGT